jgi:microcystin-dependent protein
MPENPYLGEISMAGFSYAPNGYALCDGQLMSISQNTALFSLLGTTYGGDGQTNFALPDLRGRVPLGQGTGPGLSTRPLGETGGTEGVTLTTGQLPSHTHALNVSSNGGNATTPVNNFLAPDAIGGSAPFETGATGSNAAMAGAAIGNTGSSQSHSNVQPFLCLSFYIALQGIYPSQN